MQSMDLKVTDNYGDTLTVYGPVGSLGGTPGPLAARTTPEGNPDGGRGVLLYPGDARKLRDELSAYLGEPYLGEPEVEPFEIPAKCCCSDTVDSGCQYVSGALCSDLRVLLPEPEVIPTADGGWEVRHAPDGAPMEPELDEPNRPFDAAAWSALGRDRPSEFPDDGPSEDELFPPGYAGVGEDGAEDVSVTIEHADGGVVRLYGRPEVVAATWKEMGA